MTRIPLAVSENSRRFLKKPARLPGGFARPPLGWLFSALAEAGLPAICVETRHMKAVLKAQINKTDRNDARGIAQMMRAGLYRPVHVKTLRSQKLRMLLIPILTLNDLRLPSRGVRRT